MNRWLLCFVLTLSLAPFVGCRKSPDNSSTKQDELPFGAVIILLDTLRADHVSCYGHNRLTTPVIDELAKKGVRFEQVVSLAPWTLPSVAVLLSGQRPGHALDSQKRMRGSIAQVFHEAGFATAGITEGGYVSKYFGMDRGFTYYHEEEGPVRLLIGGKPRHNDSAPSGGISKTFNKATEWLEKHKDKPFFLFIHTYEPHTPYTNHYFTQGMNHGRIGDVFKIGHLKNLRSGQLTLTEAEKQYIHALYEGDIHSADRYVGEFLAFLKKIGLHNKTVVVVTSDHGEELGEHSDRYIYRHGSSLKDTQLMVPLVIYDPTRKFAVTQVSAQVRLVDVLPTVADLLGVEISYPTAGRSLMDFMTNKETSNRVAISGQTKKGPLRHSIRDGRYKYIEVIAPDRGKPPMKVPNRQLYELLNDPAEKVNLADTNPGLAKTMSVALQRYTKELRKSPINQQPEIIDKQLRQRLRSLGYVE
jgi:arylsulfatase A-like enzyme